MCGGSPCGNCSGVKLLKGNGIKTITDNDDGTFTILFDNGDTFTTSDLTGPQGIQGIQGPAGANGANGTDGGSLINVSFTSSEWAYRYIQNTPANVWQEVATIYFPGTTALGTTPTAIKAIIDADAENPTGYTFDIRVRNTTAGNTVATLTGQVNLTKSIFDLGALLGASLTATESIFVLEARATYVVDPLDPNHGGLKIYSLVIL